MPKPKRSKQEIVLKCLEAKALGLTIRETAAKYNIIPWRVFKTLKLINDEQRDSLLNTLVYDRVPIEYASQLELYRIIIKKSMEIADSVPEVRTKLEALRLAADTSHKTGQLMADSVMIAEAIQEAALVLPTPQTPSLESLPSPNPKEEDGETKDEESLANSPEASQPTTTTTTDAKPNDVSSHASHAIGEPTMQRQDHGSTVEGREGSQ